MKKKVVVLVLAAMMVLGCAMGATLAWLTDSATVTNTFTPSNINITLTETDNTKTDGSLTNTGNSYKMVPGATITKDPVVTVVEDSEKCFLFVQIEEQAMTFTKGSETHKYLEYTIADGWTKMNDTTASGEGATGDVYYRIVEASDADQPFTVIKNNEVKVSTSVGKAEMDNLAKDGAALPQLKITAYAVQYENIVDSTKSDVDNVKAAWGNRVVSTTDSSK